LKKSYIIAAVLTLALTAWVLGGYFLRTVGKETDGTAPVADAAPSMTVSVRT
jgi:multidrug efflux system membrane fusion protein